MTALQLGAVLRELAAIRRASGQEERGKLIKCAAIEVEELSAEEMERVGLQSGAARD